jgi:hypothetical protein
MPVRNGKKSILGTILSTYAAKNRVNYCVNTSRKGPQECIAELLGINQDSSVTPSTTVTLNSFTQSLTVTYDQNAGVAFGCTFVDSLEQTTQLTEYQQGGMLAVFSLVLTNVNSGQTLTTPTVLFNTSSSPTFGSYEANSALIYAVAGGGGGGGGMYSSDGYGGNGGSGGNVLFSYLNDNLFQSGNTVAFQIGYGGSGGGQNNHGQNGGNTIIGTSGTVLNPGTTILSSTPSGILNGTKIGYYNNNGYPNLTALYTYPLSSASYDSSSYNSPGWIAPNGSVSSSFLTPNYIELFGGNGGYGYNQTVKYDTPGNWLYEISNSNGNIVTSLAGGFSGTDYNGNTYNTINDTLGAIGHGGQATHGQNPYKGSMGVSFGLGKNGGSGTPVYGYNPRPFCLTYSTSTNIYPYGSDNPTVFGSGGGGGGNVGNSKNGAEPGYYSYSNVWQQFYDSSTAYFGGNGRNPNGTEGDSSDWIQPELYLFSPLLYNNAFNPPTTAANYMNYTPDYYIGLNYVSQQIQTSFRHHGSGGGGGVGKNTFASGVSQTGGTAANGSIIIQWIESLPGGLGDTVLRQSDSYLANL